jgi:hypothetical protein
MATKTKTAAIGRPQTVLPIIKKNSLLFISKTPKEIVDILFSQLQPKMRGGVTDDPKVIRRQKVSAYQQVIQYKKQAKEDGKTGINFKGRVVNGVLKKSWIHSKAPKKDE